MDTNLLIALVVIAALLIAGFAWVASRRRRSEDLRERFGSEYQRTLHETGDRRSAERELEARQKRVEALHIRDLGRTERDEFAAEWTRVQALFVDDPVGAIDEADHLVDRVMMARGYPMGEFEQRAADISVKHPDVVVNYRAARAIARRSSEATIDTEAMRQAMVHYRALFADLLGDNQDMRRDAHDERAA